MLRLLALLTLAAPSIRVTPHVGRGPAIYSPSTLAFFEFAPASGTGMGAACACATPTGAKGETLTFSRASSGTCLKGSTSSGIANGDMVTCTANQARVMPGGSGTGALGLLVERTKTNNVLRSEEFENVAWSAAGAGVAAPTRTADQAVAPDGTTTADRVQIPATTAVQHSYSFQAISLAGAGSAGLFVKGNGQGGTFDLCLFNNGGAAYVCTPCTYVAASWTRCKNENVPAGAINATYLYGNASDINGGTARSAQDMFVWGAQWEVGGAAFVSSYIKTTAAAATRATETATFPATLSNATGSMFASLVATSTLTDTDHAFAALATAGPTWAHILDFRGTIATYTLYSAAGGGVSVGATVSANTEVRAGGFWTSAADVTAVFASSFTNSTWVAVTPSTLIEIGAFSAGNQADAVIKKLCLDPSPSRCR